MLLPIMLLGAATWGLAGCAEQESWFVMRYAMTQEETFATSHGGCLYIKRWNSDTPRTAVMLPIDGAKVERAASLIAAMAWSGGPDRLVIPVLKELAKQLPEMMSGVECKCLWRGKEYSVSTTQLHRDGVKVFRAIADDTEEAAEVDLARALASKAMAVACMHRGDHAKAADHYHEAVLGLSSWTDRRLRQTTGHSQPRKVPSRPEPPLNDSAAKQQVELLAERWAELSQDAFEERVLDGDVTAISFVKDGISPRRRPATIPFQASDDRLVILVAWGLPRDFFQDLPCNVPQRAVRSLVRLAGESGYTIQGYD